MKNKIFSGDQIAYQDQTLKLIKGVESFSEKILHVFNTTDSFGRISKTASFAVDSFFSFSYFNYEIDDKLPWASHIHYEKFLGQSYFSLKEINQFVDIEDVLKSLGIDRTEFYHTYLHSQTRSQISYLDKTITAKAIEGDIYKILINSSVFKQFSMNMIKNLLEIAPDENKDKIKQKIREMKEIIVNSESLLAFNNNFVQYFLGEKVLLTDNFEQFDIQKPEFYTALKGWLDNYEIYKYAYNNAIQGSSLKTLKTGDIPYFCVNINTKTREDMSYDATKGEIILHGDKKIPYTTMDELLLQLKVHNCIIIPKALMLSYQKLLHGDIILPKKGSEYIFLLHKFYKHIKELGIAPDINKLLIVEFDLFKEFGTLDILKIPSKLVELLGISISDQTISLPKDRYIEVSGHDFYKNYIKKYNEANEKLSIIKSNKDNIIEQMKNIGFDKTSEYETLMITLEKILKKIRNRNLNGKINPELLQEKSKVYKYISEIKKAFYLHILKIIIDYKYITKLDKNSFRPYILWLLAINPDLINKLVNNAKIAIFDIENNCYQEKK